MEKIIGLDLGTNSIGLAVRDFDNTVPITEQIELVGTNIFPSGVGKDKSGEFSYATARTKKRTVRRMYQARKYRIWATLELLIKNNCFDILVYEVIFIRRNFVHLKRDALFLKISKIIKIYATPVIKAFKFICIRSNLVE